MPASTTFVKAKTALVMKIEGVSGTAETTIADSQHNIKFFDIGISPEVETYAQEFASGRHSKGRSALGKRKITFTAKASMMSASAGYSEPALAKALKVCGQAIYSTTISFFGNFASGHSLTGKVNGVTMSTVNYATSHANTMTLISTAINTAVPCTRVVNGSTITITSTTPIVLTEFATAGTTPPTVICGTTYVPDCSKDEGTGVTATIWAVLIPASGNTNAVVVKGKGCMGNCVISMDALGSPLVAAFTFTGAFVAIEDATAPVLTGADTAYAPATIGGSVVAGGVNQQISKFSLDFGNTIELDQDPADATGYSAAYISKRAPKLMVTNKLKKLSEDVTGGTSNYARWMAGSEVAFTMITAANSALQKYSISAPKAQITAMPFGNNGEEWAWSQTYELHENVGNDEFTVTMGA